MGEKGGKGLLKKDPDQPHPCSFVDSTQWKKLLMNFGKRESFFNGGRRTFRVQVPRKSSPNASHKLAEKGGAAVREDGGKVIPETLSPYCIGKGKN